MTLPIPAYVQVEGLDDSSIQHAWMDDDIHAIARTDDHVLRERLALMSQRAIAAFSIGASEWIVQRFSSHDKDPLLRQYLEAAWARVCEFDYAQERNEFEHQRWRGPVRGPLGVAARYVRIALDHARDERNPEAIAEWLSKTVVHVLPDPGPYLRWRDQVIARLTALYPFDLEESLGDPVPWQFLDPAFDARLEDTQPLLDTFVRGLDHSGHPFLNAPQAALAQGFKGTPYVFDLEADRKRRFEW